MNEIQSRILDIYKEISKLCNKHNIECLGVGGTVLGAIRHNGFIPWDDDMDIAIPIERFYEFMELASKELPPHLEIEYPGKTKYKPLLFAKVMDNRTTFVEKYYVNRKEAYGGVWVDIFPFGGVPEDEREWNLYIHKLVWIQRLYKKSVSTISSEKTIRGKVLALFCKPLQMLPNDFFWKQFYKEAIRYKFHENKFVGHVWEPIKIMRKRSKFPQEWFWNAIDVPFEDTTIKCPNDYDTYLTLYYGNYMELPPIEQRQNWHDFRGGIVDLNKPYKEYQK